MKYIVENWFVIVGLIAVCAAGGYAVYVFVKMPSDKQLNKVREWLLYAVTKAEKELGGGTGQIKLRYVYDMFVARFTWLARVISFEAFSMMVDEALERMKKMLESNKAMQTLVSLPHGSGRTTMPAAYLCHPGIRSARISAAYDARHDPLRAKHRLP